MRQVIHKVALVALSIVALVSVASAVRFPLKGVTSVEQCLHPILGFAFWSFLIWKICKRPRKWGLGVGIFLLFVTAFQTYLWSLSIARPNHTDLGIASTTSGFILCELPIVVAAGCCILLRWQFPDAPHTIQRKNA